MRQIGGMQPFGMTQGCEIRMSASYIWGESRVKGLIPSLRFDVEHPSASRSYANINLLGC